MPLSNNADLMPSNPFIGWYTQMARKMIDDVKTKRISEADARDNIQQAYHEVMVRQAQDSRDQDEREAAARTRVRSAQAQEKATADAQQNAEDERAATIAQAKADQFCACAAQSVEDTCAVATKNPKVAVALCATARILYAQQGCR